jgi:hypothetical protein
LIKEPDRKENKLYYSDSGSAHGLLLICTMVRPFTDIKSKNLGWFGILFPTKNLNYLNDFIHLSWQGVKPAVTNFMLLKSTQKYAVIKRSFKIKEIEKAYI